MERVAAIPNTVPEKSGANSLIIGYSPPVMSPYNSIASIISAMTAVELQPIAGTKPIQIAGPISAIFSKIFLTLVFDKLVFLSISAESGPPLSIVTPVAILVIELVKPLSNIEIPKT